MGGRLSGPKLRLLLMAMLGRGDKPSGIAEIIKQFAEH
jgi:hypothetical protein